ncbi:hypothetical protein ACFE04_006632 [Oxalis oulophora]
MAVSVTSTSIKTKEQNCWVKEVLKLIVNYHRDQSGKGKHKIHSFFPQDHTAGPYTLHVADHLRQGTLQQMSRILTTPQAARGLLALGQYFQRLNGYVFLRLIRSQHPKDGYTAGVAEYITSNNLRLLSLPHAADLYGLQILADGI